jgi:RNA polymerase sigma-70 factor (ECF subfamily)
MNDCREFDRWYAVHVRPCESILKARIRHILRERSMAQDVVQDVLLEIVRTGRWRTIDSPRSYLIRAVHNRALRALEQRRLVGPLPDFEDMRFADLTPDAAQSLADRQELTRLMTFIDSLPPKCRRTVTLRRLDGFSVREIAARTGTSVSSVESHLATARHRIAAFMAGT